VTPGERKTGIQVKSIMVGAISISAIAQFNHDISEHLFQYGNIPYESAGLLGTIERRNGLRQTLIFDISFNLSE
jgi:hypothetical protein